MVPIHASEVGEILFGEPLTVYASKMGVETEDSYLMRRGLRMEDAIADEYAEQTMRTVTKPSPYEIQRHPTIPWLRSTCDRFTVRYEWPAGRRSDGPLELKLAVGSYADWKDGPPLRHQIQVQIQVACARSQWGALAGLLGPGPLQTFDLERDDEFLALALPHIEEFRDRVRLRIPPEPRSSLALPALKRMYNSENGETITPGPEAAELVERWERARTAQAASEEWKFESEAKLRALMAGASWARLEDGSLLVLSRRKDGVTVLKHEHRRGRR
jgi:hypothetical protein